jgi:lysophospholipase L1-like esterase
VENPEPLWWRISTRVALVAASVLVTFAALECGLRLATPTRAALPTAAAPPAGLRLLRTLGDFASPNARGHMAGGATYRTNAAGFRGRDYAQPKPSGVFRIAVIGDSVTMGSGVAEEDTYAARIERALNDPPGPVTYEVLNLGLAGLNATNVVERLALVGLAYDPDLIVYGYTLNDIEGPAYRVSRSPENHLMGDLTREQWNRNRLYVTTFLRTHLYSLEELVWPPKGSYVWELDDNYFNNPPALAALDQAFGRLEGIARERGVCVVVLQHTSLWFLHGFHPFRRHHEVVAKLALAHGFTNKDSLAHFLGRDGLSLWVNPADPHPNGEGHALLAAAALEALHDLPARCWATGATPPRKG